MDVVVGGVVVVVRNATVSVKVVVDVVAIVAVG